LNQGDIRVSRSGAVGTITLCRPKKKNTLTPSGLSAMSQAIRDMAAGGAVRALIIRGEGSEMFSAGYDIAYFSEDPPQESNQEPKAPSSFEEALQALAAFPYPSIAMLNGDAYGGGCELAIACDLRIAGDHVKMGMPPVKLGLVYPYPGFRRFMKVLGFAVTLEIFLTGRMYDSRTCLLKGLVNDVYPAERLEEEIRDLAERMANHAPLAVKGSKQALHALAEAPEMSPEKEATLWRLFTESLKSEDFKEGRQAFMEKRPPRFRGQ